MYRRLTDGGSNQDLFDLTPFNTTLSREMDGRPFYAVCLIPDFSFRLSGTLCFDLMEKQGRILLAEIICVGTL